MGLKYGLPLLSPVDDAGVFTEEAGQFQGLQVQCFAIMNLTLLPAEGLLELPRRLILSFICQTYLFPQG